MLLIGSIDGPPNAPPPQIWPQTEEFIQRKEY